jgi:uncharacterized iron-regulated protein
MIMLMFFATAAAGLVVGAYLGRDVAGRRTAAALKLARYQDAIALAYDLVKTPDALDLRPRAQQIIAAHEAAHHRE